MYGVSVDDYKIIQYCVNMNIEYKYNINTVLNNLVPEFGS